MAQGNINLHIGSSFDDAGFRRLDRNVKVANKTIGKFGHSFGSVAAASHDVAAALQSTTDVSYQFGGSLGQVAKAAAPILGGILSMGVWGAVIGAIGVVVGLLKKLVMNQKDARLAAKGMSAEYMTLEYQAKRYKEHISTLVAKHSELVAAMKEAASLANAKDAEALDAYSRQLDYSLSVAKSEEQIVSEIAAQAKLKREMAALDARSARRKENGGFSAQQASQNFEQESAWHIEAVTKMANANIAMAKAEADQAVAAARVEMEAQSRALSVATEHYGSSSRAAESARNSLIAAQEKMARTVEKSALSVERSQKAADESIMRANLSAARQRAKNAAAMVKETEEEGKIALESAREVGKEQIRAAEAAVKIAQYQADYASKTRQRTLETHDRKTARDEAVAQADVEEKQKALDHAKGISRGARSTEVIKAETALAAAERNLEGITSRAAITRSRMEHEGDIRVGEAEQELAKANERLNTARLGAEKAEKETVQKNEETLAAVKRQAKVLKELADYKAKEVQTARQAQALNEKSVRENAALDARIAAAKTAAAKWQEEMARVHQRDAQGRQIDFNEFKRREKQRGRELRRDEQRGQKIDAQAEGERDRLQNRIFDRNGKLRKSANKQDIARWQELNRFIEMRRGNNPAQKVVDALEKQKAKNVADIAKNVADIQKALGQLGL